MGWAAAKRSYLGRIAEPTSAHFSVQIPPSSEPLAHFHWGVSASE